MFRSGASQNLTSSSHYLRICQSIRSARPSVELLGGRNPAAGESNLLTLHFRRRRRDPTPAPRGPTTERQKNVAMPAHVGQRTQPLPSAARFPVAAPWGRQILDRGGGHVPHMRAAGHARHVPSKRRDWHVPLPWALTGTTRGRHNNRPGRPAGPGPSLRQHHKGGRVGQKQVEGTQEGQSTQQQQSCRKCRAKGECLEIPRGIRNAGE